MGFKLRITKGKSEGKEFSFAKDQVTAGRNHDNDLVLYDLNVSRRHFEIVIKGSGYVLRDLGSQNGTRLNSKPAVEDLLREGDRISVGSVEFEFCRSDTQPHLMMDENTDRAEVNAPSSMTQRVMLEELQTYAFNLDEIKRPPSAKPNKTRSRAGLRRYLVPVAVGIVSFVALIGLFVTFYHPKKPDLSSQVFALSAATDHRSFGAGNVDIPTPSQAQFRFTSRLGRTILSLTPGGIEQAGQVAVLLNGIQVQSLPTTGHRWGNRLDIKLSRKLLHAGDDNLIVLQPQTSDSDGPTVERHWGIKDLSLNEDPIPPPSRDRARELIAAANDLVLHEKVAAPNLATAEDDYKRALLSLEGYDPPPDEYGEVEKKYAATKAELDQLIADGLFRSERAVRYGKTDEALALLRSLLLYVPRESDPRREEILAHVAELPKK